ncbi:MAG: FprA family A-type flavoprotein [Lachnospiraceae bacterium]|nr:FprA family A-type flavoprotein [Lachnospiraceae bacterium]
MHCVRKVTDDLYWVGANDHRLHLFENIHPIPQGVSYNSYLLLDEKSVLFDTVDWSACRQLLDNMEYLLKGKELDVLLINHLEPDHAASIEEVLIRNPHCEIICTEKGFMLMRQFGFDVEGHKLTQVKEGDTTTFGKHTVTYVEAPMVHWPEAMITLDLTNGVLFSADAFGSFIALDGKLFADEVNFDRDWLDEARRYYTNIVGKYGPHVVALINKAVPILDKIKIICPLHGPVWRKDIPYILDKYIHWATYEPEETRVVIAYASMYGNTEGAAQNLACKLCDRGVTNVAVYDVSNTNVSYLISEVFRSSHLVLASVTYNLGIYPIMHNFLEDMKALNVQNRTVAIIENGSWACRSGDLMQKFLDEELKTMTVLNERLSLASSLKNDKEDELNLLADSIAESVKAEIAAKQAAAKEAAGK